MKSVIIVVGVSIISLLITASNGLPHTEMDMRLDASKAKEQWTDEEVRELENLKPTSASKEPVTNEETSSHDYKEDDEFLEQVREKLHPRVTSPNGEPPARKLRELGFDNSNIEYPNDDILREVYRPQLILPTKPVDVGIDHSDSLVTIEIPIYAPEELAEYIFVTGDEKSVSTAIESYIDNKMMTKKEALEYVKEVAANLEEFAIEALEERDQVKRSQDHHVKERVAKSMFESQKFDVPKHEENVKNEHMDKPKYKSVLNADEFMKPNLRAHLSDDNYNLLIEKLKTFEKIFPGGTMEDMVYRMAKILFSRTFSEGTDGTRKVIEEYNDFLENEVDAGRISPQLEAKILALMSKALADIIAENPENVAVIRHSIMHKDPIYLHELNGDKHVKKPEGYGYYSQAMQNKQRHHIKAFEDELKEKMM